MVKYMHKKYATDRVIAETDAADLRYVHPNIITPKQYTGDLLAKSCKVGDVYDEGTPYKILIKDRDIFITRDWRNCWATNPRQT